MVFLRTQLQDRLTRDRRWPLNYLFSFKINPIKKIFSKALDNYHLHNENTIYFSLTAAILNRLTYHASEEQPNGIEVSFPVAWGHPGWTANRGILNKKVLQVRAAFVHLKTRLPFDLLAVNTDSGSEFINEEIFELMNSNPVFRAQNHIEFTRSRPFDVLTALKGFTVYAVGDSLKLLS